MSVSLSADAYTAMMTEMNADKSEIRKLKEHLNSLLTEEQKDIIKGEGLINPENAIYCPDDLVKRIQSFLKERDELAEENVQLNDDDWVITYHKALKYKCVLDEDYYLQHLNDEGQLIDPDEFNALQEENKKLKEEITTLVTFTIGGGDPEETSDVEKIITDTMSKEFIDNNQEHWDLIGLFED